MSKWDKLLQRICSLSNDMRFDELRKVIESYGYVMTQPRSGSSHYRASLKTPFEKKQLCTSSASSTSLGVRQHAFGRFPCSCRTYLFFL